MRTALENMFQENPEAVDYFTNYGNHLSKLLAELNVDSILSVVQCFLKARSNDKTIYFAGNGGSAATASHFSQDMAEIGRKIKGKGFRALSITDNTATLTAISNDYDYAQVFSMQIQYNFNPGDILVVISASGNSQNVINAVELAKQKGGITIGLVGFDGGRLVGICDYVIHAKTSQGEYGPVEDIHLILNHMITSYLIMELKKEEGCEE